MNAYAQNSLEMKIYRLLKRVHAKLQGLGISGDVILFIIILAGLNSHLIGGSGANLQVFFPAALRSGEWWRLFSHPFVHLTWYHLFLDAGAFFISTDVRAVFNPLFRTEPTALHAPDRTAIGRSKAVT